MKQAMKKAFFIALLLTTAAGMKAQEKKVETIVSADILSQYVWRGQHMGSASIQPVFGLAYGGLSLRAEGNIGISDASDPKELDIFLDYTVKGFTFGFTDYWADGGGDPENRYFKYDSHSTNHIYEVSVGYDFGPLQAQWYTYFAGDDGLNKSGKRAYSSYVELTTPFRLGGADWMVTAGATPYATTSYQTTGFSVINLKLRATKELRVSDSFSIPIYGELATNPSERKAYLVVGLTLCP